MSSTCAPDLEPCGPTIYVGQDRAGHWLVQDDAKRMEGHFVSFAAAMSFAKAEQQTHHATLAIVTEPLSPFIPFPSATAQPSRALRHA